MDPDETLTALREGDRERRRQAARSLWETSRSDPSTLSEGIETLQAATEEADPLVRGHAVATLGESLFGIYDYDAPIPELDAVLARLTDEDDGVRQTVTGLLWNREWWLSVGGDDDHPITDEQRRLASVGLVDCLGDPVFLTRKRASRELRPSLVVAHPDPELATAAVVAALEDDGAATRSNAAEVLTGVADREPSFLDPHVERLRQAMAEDDAVRSEIAEGLASLIDRFPALAAPVAGQVIESDPDYSTGERQRVSTLGTVLAANTDFEGSEEALAALESALEHRNIKVRAAAAAALGRVAASEPEAVESAVPALRQRLHDYHEQTRRAAAGALAAALDRDTVEPPLVTLFESLEAADEPPDPLLVLADSHPAYVSELLRKLRDETPDPPHDTRLSVAAILEHNPEAVHPILEDCVADLAGDDANRRNGAAWLLGQVTLEHPAEGRRCEKAIRSAVDRPEDFDDLAHRKLRKALEELNEAEGPNSGAGRGERSDTDGCKEGGDRRDIDDKQRSLRDFFPF